MKLLWWILVLPLIALAAAFAVANRAAVTIDLDPLPFAVEAPLYAVVMAAIFAGLVIGGVVAWLAGGKRRREVRRLKRNLKMLESEVASLRARLAEPVAESDKAEPRPEAMQVAGRADDTAPLPPANQPSA